MSVFSSITFRLNAFVIGLLALSAAGIVAVGGTMSSLSFETHMRTITFPALMDTVAGMVDKELIAPARTLESMATNPFFTGWIAEGGNEAQSSHVFAMGRELMKTYQTNGVNLVLRDNLNYFQLDRETERVFTTSKERDPWFFEFEESGKPLWVNIYGADDPLYPDMIFFNQRIQQNGRFVGSISTGMKTESVLKRLTEMSIGKRGAIMLVRKDGSLLAHTNKDLIGLSLTELPEYKNVSADFLSGRLTEFEYTNAAGRHALVLARTIPVLDLILMSEIDIDEMLEGMNEAKWYAMGSGLLFLLLGCMAGVLLIRTVTNPLHSIMSIAEYLIRSKEGGTQGQKKPLQQTHDALVSRKDELGSLARVLDVLVGSMQKASALAQKESARAQEESVHVREAMQEVNLAKKETEERTHKIIDLAKRLATVADVVKTASFSLEQDVNRADKGARAQADHLEETATAMTEMTATVIEVAKSASVASKSSNTTRKRAENGAEVVRRVVESIKRVQEQSSALKADMGRLGQSAQDITHIMGVISDIADQTNLLALNAAIEAARAGDAGRGFAVVADEVRKLAEKTMVSTVDVGNAIRAIQTSADNSQVRMDTAVESVSEATTLAAESGAALDEIVCLMEEAADQVRSIATAAEEQSATSEQINQSVGEVRNSSRESAQAMHNASNAVTDLTRQARILAGLIDELNAS